MNFRYLMAVDPSLTCSGWALFSVLEGGGLRAVGKVRSLTPSLPLAIRLKDLQSKIDTLFSNLDLGLDDVLICEGPTTMKDPKAAIKVEQVRNIFEVVARKLSMRVPGRLNPRSVQSEIMGLKGKQISRLIVKEVAVSAVKSLHGESLEGIGFSSKEDNLRKHQDIVDALLIGSLALSRLESAKQSKTPIEEIFSISLRPRMGKFAIR